ncbi:flagellar basal-body rod modification protein FlgD [Clostridium tetanomorphum]|uniref:Basal-body rod modification protein FlgD n=1 Tax=Clostridium tetanomorphum TaxID=1553 RepID=A0A923EA45_CLOTT|nr:flagellar hook capping FlgD N-terminal domain-containing protein [Clostridium tetanomorphum]KAJ49915.1 basal-body rod modification protein flgD [Clostridium tetanomorphum DSM 665]MBC2396680.1 hypothetical protein [Clostridium tetanomorphum]MBP1866147.1 flagellar basal-body rod modification protein FlgD [Clostridium tetanomorphum]NRS85126.1 flagellar basal-body rod modification protein FlgD [Clostridium tetanomorphum]NRZ98307.1 flagellar basal-body rod modification protein FlgD [Clostridium 
MAGDMSITNTPKVTDTNSSNKNTNNKNTNDKNSINKKVGSASATARGTRIVQPGEGMDKNAFLRILSAELSHQDPTNAKDGTEFVSQMAQFAGLEQMANLNTNIRFVGASSLIGKSVMLNRVNENGNLYVGKVTGVSKDSEAITLNVAVGQEKDEDGNMVPIIKKFRMEDVIELVNSEENITQPPAEEKDSQKETDVNKDRTDNDKKVDNNIQV